MAEADVDFHLIQALHEARELADEHDAEGGWGELRNQVDAILERLTGDADDPSTEAVGAQRITRPPATPPEAERAIAALMAVHDLPDDRQLDLARDAVQDLEDAL
jgi:hypothetical protein